MQSSISKRKKIAINCHLKYNLTIVLQQLKSLETLVIIMVVNKYALLQITILLLLNEWEAFKKVISRSIIFFFNDTPTTEIYTLSLHDALPILFKEHTSHLQSLSNLLCRLPL